MALFRGTLLRVGTILATCLCTAQWAWAGSGTVEFHFSGFSGPIALAAENDPPNVWSVKGFVNSVAPTPSGDWIASPGSASGYPLGTAAIGGGNQVELTEQFFDGSPVDGGYNLIRFDPVPFTNVLPGQPFLLGTLTFQNGRWFGFYADATNNAQTRLDFTMQTTSGDGALFNQTITGALLLTVYAPGGLNFATAAGQQAEADWITIDSAAVSSPLGAFRVYDDYAKPAGASNIGTVELYGQFNSLDLVTWGAAHGGGFVTDTELPLPAVPEPGTLVFAAAGLAVLLVRTRRMNLRGGQHFAS